MLAETSPILILANATHSSQPLPWPHIVYYEDMGREKKEKSHLDRHTSGNKVLIVASRILDGSN